MKRKYNIEIEYEYHPGGEPVTGEHPRLHWMYYATSANSLQEALANGKIHYEKRIRDLGWGKIVTLREIRPPKRGSDPLTSKPSAPAPTPTRSSSSKPKRKPRTSTEDGRKTRTSKNRVKKS